MLMLGGSNSNSNRSSSMGLGTQPFFHELKKQASFFFKEKIRNARLALTDVTPAELLTEEATNGNPWAPDTRTMGFISRAAFEIDDYWRIVEILHKRLERFDRKHWRESYQALVLLEHLLTHGPESVSLEFQSDRDVMKEMESFQHIDERGFNWGLAVRKKSERVLKLLERGPLLREERDRSRKLTRGIEGFGSFGGGRSSVAANGSGGVESSFGHFGRSNSHYCDSSGQEDAAEDDRKENSSSISSGGLGEGQMKKRGEAEHEVPKENKKNAEEVVVNGKEVGILMKEISPPEEESRPLLSYGEEEGPKMTVQMEDHPFSWVDQQSAESLLLSQT